MVLTLPVAAVVPLLLRMALTTLLLPCTKTDRRASPRLPHACSQVVPPERLAQELGNVELWLRVCMRPYLR